MNHGKRCVQGFPARPSITVRDFIVFGFFLLLASLATIPCLKDNYVMGKINQALPAPGDQWLVMVEEIWSRTEKPVLLHQQVGTQIEKGTWIIDRGTPQAVGEKEIQVLLVDEHHFILGWPLSILADLTTPGRVTEFFERHPLLAAIAGALILLLGSWFIRLIACFGIGCLVSFLVSLAVIVGHFEGYLAAPMEDYLLVIALFGLLVGFFLPIQKGSLSEFIAQRIIMLVVLFFFGEEVSKTFDCLPEITGGVALIVTLLNPLFGIVILSGFLLVIATGATSIAIPIVLTALILVTLLLHGGQWKRIKWLTGIASTTGPLTD
ncbi:MAG: hypothetical protein KC964_18225 [Candidatus Omnitrophica bacterium]|nr:hypothetical protein [Candidatus Omnitrophota bacterium]